jgi:D-alanyl-D-alanine carboxypeptidase (penicillin-binding protein 5/6)
MSKVITMSESADTIGGSEDDFYVGEQLTVHDLLLAMMLDSANNAGMALAVAEAGSADKFVEQMNDKAKLLGLKDTHYEDPVGLNDNGHSTARDLALLMDYDLTLPAFRSLIETETATITSVDGKYEHNLNNSTRLIHPDQPLYLPAAIGGKTGYTDNAGHCLVAAAQYGTKQYIAVILNTTANTNDASANEAYKLLSWAGQLH